MKQEYKVYFRCPTCGKYFSLQKSKLRVYLARVKKLGHYDPCCSGKCNSKRNVMAAWRATANVLED